MRGQLFHGCFYTDAVLGSKLVDFAVLNETIGPANAHYRRFDLHVAERLQDRAAKSPHKNVIFQGDDDCVATGVLGQRVTVEWFNETGVDHSYREALLPELRGQLLRHGQ